MTQILIAAFDRYAQAEQVKAELVTEGVSHDDIQLSMSMNPSNVDGSHVEVVGEEPDSDATAAEHIGNFFRKIFGDGAAAHAGRYPEAARRGSTIVTVSLQNEERVQIVEQIMERNGAIDIDERSATWNDDATPVTASTETLTTGYPDATSISVDERELNGTATPERGRTPAVSPAEPRMKSRPTRQHCWARAHHSALIVSSAAATAASTRRSLRRRWQCCRRCTSRVYRCSHAIARPGAPAIGWDTPSDRSAGIHAGGSSAGPASHPAHRHPGGRRVRGGTGDTPVPELGVGLQPAGMSWFQR